MAIHAGIIENQHADAMETRIVRHRCLHFTIERAHAAVSNLEILLTKKLARCEQPENYLLLDAGGNQEPRHAPRN